MNEETRASRGATAGLSNAAVAACVERYAPAPALRQDLYLARRYRLMAATAALLAELAFPSAEIWRGRA